jgi:5-methylcytosine-specific restriction protein A
MMQQNDIVSNEDICKTFLCSPQGGMRRSLRTNSLILISGTKRSVYVDRWVGDVFHYTGMGLSGDQSLYDGQNWTLAGSPKTGIKMYLFAALDKNQYRYEGRVELADQPYQEQQQDTSGHARLVWVFPLRLVN